MILPAFMLFITILIVQNIIFTSLLNFGLIIVSFIIGVLIGIALGNFFDVKVEKDGTMVSLEGVNCCSPTLDFGNSSKVLWRQHIN